MVSQEAVVFLALSGAIAFLLPIRLIVWFKRKYGATLKVFFIGALTFFVFAQLLEGGVSDATSIMVWHLRLLDGGNF